MAQDHAIVSEDPLFNLTSSHVHDSGRYTCIASNQYGNSKSSIVVKVIPAARQDTELGEEGSMTEMNKKLNLLEFTAVFIVLGLFTVFVIGLYVQYRKFLAKYGEFMCLANV